MRYNSFNIQLKKETHKTLNTKTTGLGPVVQCKILDLTDLSYVIDSHLLGGMLVVYLIHNLYFRVVIARTERPQLREPSFLCTGADLTGVSLEHSPVLLTMFLVLGPGIT